MKKVIAIIGPAGSGKDLLAHEVRRDCRELNNIISYTTRAPRSSEAHGKDYYFITEAEFMAQKADFLEYTNFNGWYYGTKKTDFKEDKVNIGVFNVDGVRALLLQPDVEVKIFFIIASARERLLRQLERDKNVDVDEIIRRYHADNCMFDQYNLVKYGITRNNIIILSNETIEDLRANIPLISEYATHPNSWAK